jgi:predicted membrane protein
MVGACSRNGEKRNMYRILLGKSEGKRPLERPRRRWVGNIKMDLREIEWDDVDWIDMSQDRDQWRALVNTVLNLSISIKCWEVLEGLRNWWLLKKGSAP